MPPVRTNSFVKRQVAASRFSHFMGDWEELEHLVEANIGKGKEGYRAGVMLVPVPPEQFFSGVVEIKNSVLRAKVEARKEGEEPVIVVEAEGQKLPAKFVEVVLYHYDVLQLDGDGQHPGCWEIISINASPLDHGLPMNPTAMARNQLHKVGGTQGSYSPEEWAEAVWFWSIHAMVAEPVKLPGGPLCPRK